MCLSRYQLRVGGKGDEKNSAKKSANISRGVMGQPQQGERAKLDLSCQIPSLHMKGQVLEKGRGHWGSGCTN